MSKEEVRLPLKDAGRISVDAEKFGRGMETVLSGMAEVFGSLGADFMSEYTPARDVAKPPHVEEATAPPAAQSPKPEEPATAKPAILYKDIVSVITKKIQQDQNNNEAIKKILPGFNAKKVSELRPEQYEAFMMELGKL